MRASSSARTAMETSATASRMRRSVPTGSGFAWSGSATAPLMSDRGRAIAHSVSRTSGTKRTGIRDWLRTEPSSSFSTSISHCVA